MLLIRILTAVAMAVAPPPLDQSTCADPAQRKAFLDSYKDPEQLPLLATLKQGAEDNEKKFSAKLDRLAERANWSAEKKAEFAMAMLKDPEFGKLMEQSMAVLDQMMKKLEVLKAEKDDGKQCLVVVAMFADLPRISAITDRQWALMDARMEAEAKKAGVSLD